MKSFGRGIVWLIPVLLTILGLLWPVLSSPITDSGTVSDPVTISSLHAEFAVDRDGLLQAD